MEPDEYVLAADAIGVRDWPAALSALERARARAREEGDAESEAQALQTMAQVHLEAGKHLALALFEQADSLAPESCETRLNHAIFLARWAGLPERAQQKLNEARELARLHRDGPPDYASQELRAYLFRHASAAIEEAFALLRAR